MNNIKKKIFVIALIISLVGAMGCGDSKTAFNITSAKGAGNITFTTQIPTSFFDIYGGTAEDFCDFAHITTDNIDNLKISYTSEDEHFINFNYEFSFDSIEEYNTIMYYISEAGDYGVYTLISYGCIPALEQRAETLVNEDDICENQKVIDTLSDQLYDSFKYEAADIKYIDGEYKLIVPSYHSVGVYVWNASNALCYAINNTDDSTRDKIEAYAKENKYLFNNFDFVTKNLIDSELEFDFDDASEEEKEKIDEVIQACTNSKINDICINHADNLEEELNSINNDNSNRIVTDAKILTALCADIPVEYKTSTNNNACDSAVNDAPSCNVTSVDAPSCDDYDCDNSSCKDYSCDDYDCDDYDAYDCDNSSCKGHSCDDYNCDDCDDYDDYDCDNYNRNDCDASTANTKTTTVESEDKFHSEFNFDAYAKIDFSKIKYPNFNFNDIDWNQGLLKDSNITFDMSFGNAKLNQVNILKDDIPNYFILSTTSFDQIDNASVDGNGNNNDVANNTTTHGQLDKTPKTADYSSIVLVSIFAFVSLGMVVFCRRKLYLK